METYNAIAEKSRRDELILGHLPLVRHVVGRLLAQLPPGMDVENLESAGVLGLVEAAGSFDSDRGVDFKTYAFARVRGAVLDELRRNCPLPQQMLERVALVRRAYQQLASPVSVDMLVEATGLSTDEVADCLAAIRLTSMASLPHGREPVGTRLVEPGEAPDETAARSEQKALLAEAIQALPERERLAVTLYYLEDLRLKEIGRLLDLSESRVSRVLNSALFHLGEHLRGQRGNGDKP
jgi:RNA polymerase sigma factor FliA